MSEHRLEVGIDDVRAAAAALDGAIQRTPMACSETLSKITGAEVHVKFENLQFTASFKERGARNKLLRLEPDQRARGVVAMSAGNHAQAVAHHATLLGIDSVIVMPEGTPSTKVSRTEDNGARVIVAGATLEDSAKIALDLAATEGRTFVPPYDDPLVVAGQGTCGLEMLEDVPDLDVLVVPVGGGGLFAGTCVVGRALAPGIELVGVQSELYPSMVAATEHDVPPPTPSWGPTIAEGIAVKRPGAITTELIRRLHGDVVTVPERAIEEAVVLFLEIEKVVAEGAGAAGLAALLVDRDRFRGKKVGVILTGGNIDLRLLSAVIMRGLARTGRLTRLVVDVPDLPGSLAELTATVGAAGANIVDLWHHREFGQHSARVTEIELLIETRDARHAQRVRDALSGRGYSVDEAPRRMR